MLSFWRENAFNMEAFTAETRALPLCCQHHRKATRDRQIVCNPIKPTQPCLNCKILRILYKPPSKRGSLKQNITENTERKTYIIIPFSNIKVQANIDNGKTFPSSAEFSARW